MKYLSFRRDETHRKRTLRNNGEQYLQKLEIIDSTSEISVCRDPDDKFIGCAVDGKAVFIVSGDKDLLSLESYKDIEIITAADFCSRYLN